MTQKQLVDIILANTGQISIDDTEAKCKVCASTGSYERVAPGITVPNIEHKKRCVAVLAVKDLLKQIKGSNFILEVENLIPYEEIEDYEAEISSTDYKDIEELTNAVFAAATEEDRKKLYPRLAAYDNHDASSAVLERIAVHGIETPTERENLKSFLIYLKAHQSTVDDFMQHAIEMENERNYMARLFDQAFPI